MEPRIGGCVICGSFVNLNKSDYCEECFLRNPICTSCCRDCHEDKRIWNYNDEYDTFSCKNFCIDNEKHNFAIKDLKSKMQECIYQYDNNSDGKGKKENRFYLQRFLQYVDKLRSSKNKKPITITGFNFGEIQKTLNEMRVKQEKKAADRIDYLQLYLKKEDNNV